MAKVKKVIHSARELDELAEFFVQKFLSKKRKNALLVTLSGDLGAGKTTFTQRVSKKFGIKKKIISPTFVIIKRYPVKFQNFKNFFHIDAYRLKDKKEILKLGFTEVLADPANIIFLEWPENIKGLRYSERVKITIRDLSEHVREFTFEN